jgi:hypothetical protein
MPNVNFCSNESTDDEFGLTRFIKYSCLGVDESDVYIYRVSKREFSRISQLFCIADFLIAVTLASIYAHYYASGAMFAYPAGKFCVHNIAYFCCLEEEGCEIKDDADCFYLNCTNSFNILRCASLLLFTPLCAINAARDSKC